MSPEDFIQLYEQALDSQNWEMVAPLIHEKACVTFSTGVVHSGKDAVKDAFKANFSMIKGEVYEIKDVKWLLKSDTAAVYLFCYKWQGYINDKLLGGEGLGTSVLSKEGEKWYLLTEHLGPKKQ